MKNLKSYTFALATILMLVSAAIYITGWEYSKHIFVVSSCAAAIIRISEFKTTSNSTLRRLRIQQIFASLAFIVTGIFMFTNRAGNEWIACFAIATLLEVYTAFRIPYVEKKDN